VPTCVLYLRLSDLRTEEAFDKRVAKLNSLADALGWIVFRVVIENDMIPGRDGKLRPASAFKRKKIITPSGRKELRVIRPGFREVLEDLETGRANALLAEDLDRVFRDPRDLEDFIDIAQEHKVSARSLSGSLTFTNGGTDAEIDMARMMVTMANKASRDTARRVAGGRERNWGESYQGGRRPFGYIAAKNTEHLHRTLLIVPDESELIVKWTDQILNQGVSLKAILRDIRQNGIPSASGGEWNGRTLKQVLTKPTVAGLTAYKGQLKPAPWPAILEQDVWERLCERLSGPLADTSRGNEPKHLLTGIAKCGICNDGTSVRANGSGTLRGKKGYQCEKIAHIHRNIELVDAWVERNVTAYISRYSSDILKPELREDIDATKLRAEAKKLRERKTAQMRMYSLGEIDESDLKTGLRAIRDRLAVIDAQLANAEKPDPLPEFRHHGPTRKIWHGLSLARKRAIIRQIVDITMLPTTRRGPGFDRGSVKITDKKTGEIIDVSTWPVEVDMSA
jgi:DNA invertase Pin-like site-specific DNA recombinase